MAVGAHWHKQKRSKLKSTSEDEICEGSQQFSRMRVVKGKGTSSVEKDFEDPVGSAEEMEDGKVLAGNFYLLVSCRRNSLRCSQLLRSCSFNCSARVGPFHFFSSEGRTNRGSSSG